jgi:diguanylate cyclase (GGDEF)-like protein
MTDQPMVEERKLYYERILIIDDEEITRMMLRRVLEESGYWVLEAANGQQGLQTCLLENPDAVLMDVRMPVMNGFEACQAIRQEPGISRIPILMLTSLDDVVAVQLAFDAGATDFVTKPINWALLAQRVRYALRAREIERQMRENEEQLARAQRIARLGYWRYEIAVDWLNLSLELCHLLEIDTVRGMTGSEMREHVLEDDLPLLERFIADFLQEHAEESETEIRVRIKSGRVLTLFLSANLMYDKSNQVNVIFGVAQDVTERRATEARLSYFAHFDPLTGLPNRVLFRDRLIQVINAAQRDDRRFAIIHLNLDQFQKVNASLGNTSADQVLQRLVERLKGLLRERDSLSRFGGDHFEVILTDIRSEHEAAMVAQRLLGAFDVPLQCAEWEVRVSATLGIAVYPNDGTDVETLLLHAATAYTRALELGGARYQFYTANLHHQAVERLNREAALCRALERDEFILYFQPRFDLRERRVTGAEALIRWQHPEWGLQMPDHFIGILEDNGLIIEVGEWVLRQACRAFRDLPLAVSINLSPRQFQRPDLAERMLRIVQEENFPAERLELELTERLFMHDEQQAALTLAALRESGIQVSIDDYGTGYCSLQYLKRLPVNLLKIDRSFIRCLTDDRADQAIVRSTIELCHTLNVEVVAEGVEDRATLDVLQRLGCDAIQGYYLSRPVPLEQMLEWLDGAALDTHVALDASNGPPPAEQA